MGAIKKVSKLPKVKMVEIRLSDMYQRGYSDAFELYSNTLKELKEKSNKLIEEVIEENNKLRGELFILREPHE